MELWLGILAVVFDGFLQGIFAAPMKYAPRWKFGHIWLIFSFSGMVLFPWILAISTYGFVPSELTVQISLPWPPQSRLPQRNAMRCPSGETAPVKAESTTFRIEPP
jgi:hypothetical protein